jgi:hypothetical protein
MYDKFYRKCRLGNTQTERTQLTTDPSYKGYRTHRRSLVVRVSFWCATDNPLKRESMADEALPRE